MNPMIDLIVQRSSVPGFFEIEKDGIVIMRRYAPSKRWDDHWMEGAIGSSKLTRCFSRHAGAKIVDDYRFEISSGFNGPPMGTRHPQERHPEGKEECPRRFYGFTQGQMRQICPCDCAERSAIYLAARLGRATDQKTMYLVTNPSVLPCFECTLGIIKAGINELVVSSFNYYDTPDPRAVDILELFREAGVIVRLPLQE